jgi:hypothetical protein
MLSQREGSMASTDVSIVAWIECPLPQDVKVGLHEI